MPRVLHIRRPARRLVGGGISEAEEHFEQRVILEARIHRWHGFHVRKSFGSVMGVSRADAYGWPDWVLWNTDLARFILRELKTETGRVMPHQTATLAALRLCGIDAKVWRPSDWAEITRTFAG